MSITVEVENIKCGGCANSIQKSLLKHPEVSSVEVNVEQGQVIISAPESSLTAIRCLARLRGVHGHPCP